MGSAVNPEFFQIVCRPHIVINRNEIWPAIKSMLNSAKRWKKRSPGMRKIHSQLWKSFKNSAKNHRANCPRSFRWHTNKPGKPISLHLFFAHHIPGMNEHGHT
jgi:hypothetical protein